MIIKDGREEEFADIMPILSKKIKIRRVLKSEKADIVFNFVYDIKKHCSSNAGGCISWKRQNKEDRTSYAYVRIPNPTSNKENYSEEKVFHIIAHEIGHYFGLTDQYYQKKKDRRRGYTVHNNPRISYKESTMGASYKPYLDCDDVDGFINLIDLTLSLDDGEFSDRAQKGWASFCNGKKNEKGKYYKEEFYKEAKLMNKPDYVRNGKIYHYDKNGNISSVENQR